MPYKGIRIRAERASENRRRLLQVEPSSRIIEIQKRFRSHLEISGHTLGVIHGDRPRARHDLRNSTLRDA